MHVFARLLVIPLYPSLRDQVSICIQPVGRKESRLLQEAARTVKLVLSTGAFQALPHATALDLALHHHRSPPVTSPQAADVTTQRRDDLRLRWRATCGPCGQKIEEATVRKFPAPSRETLLHPGGLNSKQDRR